MTDNFYNKFLKKMEEIHPSIIELLQNRPIVIRDKGNNDYQAYWEKRMDAKYTSIITNFESLLTEYNNYQNLGEKAINKMLSISDDDNIKSILNLLRKDIWFDSDVHSKFKRDRNNYFRYYRGVIQSKAFLENIISFEDAEKAMIDIIRKELIESFQAKFSSIIQYLSNESKILEQNLKQICISDQKYARLFSFGEKSIKSEPTAAMILLGVSLECLLKTKHISFIQERCVLEVIIKELERRKTYDKEIINLLKKVCNLYGKAKHERATLIPDKEVKDFYEQTAFLFT